MTRINCIPPIELTRQHLLAEYRELPRIFALAAKSYPLADVPTFYVLGKGHVRFFYDKLKFLANRHYELRQEMRRRSYKVKVDWDFSEYERTMPDAWNDWTPTVEAMAINRERITKRLAGDRS